MRQVNQGGASEEGARRGEAAPGFKNHSSNSQGAEGKHGNVQVADRELANGAVSYLFSPYCVFSLYFSLLTS